MEVVIVQPRAPSGIAGSRVRRVQHPDFVAEIEADGIRLEISHENPPRDVCENDGFGPSQQQYAFIAGTLRRILADLERKS